MSDIFNDSVIEEYDEDKINCQGICLNHEWCDYKTYEKGQYLCIFEFDACEYLQKADK